MSLIEVRIKKEILKVILIMNFTELQNFTELKILSG